MKKGDIVKAAVVGRWLTSPTPAPKGILKAMVWFHTILIMISVGLGIGGLFTFSIISFLMSFIFYFGLQALKILRPAEGGKPAPAYFMAFSVWIHLMLVILGLVFTQEWLLKLTIMVTFPATWLIYIIWRRKCQTRPSSLS